AHSVVGDDSCHGERKRSSPRCARVRRRMGFREGSRGGRSRRPPHRSVAVCGPEPVRTAVRAVPVRPSGLRALCQAAPGGAPPPAGAQPTSAFPAAGGGPQTIAPGQAPETDRKSGRGMLVVGIVAAMLVSGGLGGWVGASVAGGSEGGLAS